MAALAERQPEHVRLGISGGASRVVAAIWRSDRTVTLLNEPRDDQPASTAALHIKQAAEASFPFAVVDGVVLTVPTNANDDARRAAKAAAESAELKVLHIMNSSAAALVAAGIDKHGGTSTAVVAECEGDGGLVTVLEIEDGIFSVLRVEAFDAAAGPPDELEAQLGAALDLALADVVPTVALIAGSGVATGAAAAVLAALFNERYQAHLDAAEVSARGAAIQAAMLADVGDFLPVHALSPTSDARHLLPAAAAATPCECASLIARCSGDVGASFVFFAHEVLRPSERAALVRLLDARAVESDDDDARASVRDVQLTLTLAELMECLGRESVASLRGLFGGRHDCVVKLRRVEARPTTLGDDDARATAGGGGLIDFHVDTSRRTLQVCLNDCAEYDGGRLTYVTERGLEVPHRCAGTATLHDNRIVHGVSTLTRVAG